MLPGQRGFSDRPVECSPCPLISVTASRPPGFSSLICYLLAHLFLIDFFIFLSPWTKMWVPSGWDFTCFIHLRILDTQTVLNTYQPFHIYVCWMKTDKAACFLQGDLLKVSYTHLPQEVLELHSLCPPVSYPFFLLQFKGHHGPSPYPTQPLYTSSHPFSSKPLGSFFF